MKDWQEWSTSFIHILTLEKFITIFYRDLDEVSFHDLIDSLFKTEVDIKKVVVQSRAIMDVRSNKFVDDIDAVRGTKLPIKREIYMSDW